MVGIPEFGDSDKSLMDYMEECAKEQIAKNTASQNAVSALEDGTAEIVTKKDSLLDRVKDWWKETDKDENLLEALNEDIIIRYCPDGSKVIDFAYLPGTKGIEVPRRLSTSEMTYLTKEYGVEFAQVYQLGSGIHGRGGKYFVYSGSYKSVRVPIRNDLMLINHTHPRGTAYPSWADRKVLRKVEIAGSPQRVSEIIPIGKNTTIKFDKNDIR